MLRFARKVKVAGAEFCLTHCYTGYPMVRQARAMVRAGVIGPIRQLHLQYVQGYLAAEDVPANRGRQDPRDRAATRERQREAATFDAYDR